MNLKVFGRISDYYDLLYKDKDYAAEVNYIAELLAREGLRRGHLLEFGCGTGRHGRILANKGYLVHGVELSEDMLSCAESAPGFTFQQGDISEVDLGQRYDAVLALFHVICYQTTNQKLLATFRNAHKHLRMGGLFIFDFWYSPAVHKIGPSVRVKQISCDNAKITRIATPTIFDQENRVDVKYIMIVEDTNRQLVQTVEETHSVRHFTLPELDIIAGVAGFETLRAEEFLTGSEPRDDTWGICVMLKKTRESL